jgi:hypothetical protein
VNTIDGPCLLTGDEDPERWHQEIRVPRGLGNSRDTGTLGHGDHGGTAIYVAQSVGARPLNLQARKTGTQERIDQKGVPEAERNPKPALDDSVIDVGVAA